MHRPAAMPSALSIAGSDSGGGAGIQADLKAFAACGVHGTTAITAITAQNTLGVSAIHQVPPAIILAQVRAVAEDIQLGAVKIGMLGDAETIRAVGRALDELDRVGGSIPVVLDPVMMSESGAELLDPDAVEVLIECLLPRVTVLTPNLPEARLIVARSGLQQAAGAEEMTAEQLARAIRSLGPELVVVTGGHRDQATDVCFDGERTVELAGERYADGAAHGSGCTHSSALAAGLALGDDPLSAARRAKELASAAVRDGLRDVGAGPGPVDVLGIRRAAG